MFYIMICSASQSLTANHQSPNPMPTWRKLHQKTTESLDVNDLPDDFTRLLWVLLPLGLDREGRGLDNPSWVKAKLMPLRTDVSLDQIAAALECFAGRGMIRRYQVSGRSYFAIPTWGKYQGDTSREAVSVIPPPPLAPDASPGGSGAWGEGAAPNPQPSATHESLATSSRATQNQLIRDSRSDSDSESDADTEADSDSPALPAQTSPVARSGERDGPNPLELYQKSYPLSPLTPVQEGALRLLADQYGAQRLGEVIAWAAEAAIPPSRALRAIRSALPGWRSAAPPPDRLSPRPAAARPAMLEVLDQLKKDHTHGRKP
jgi:hypothetical protein